MKRAIQYGAYLAVRFLLTGVHACSERMILRLALGLGRFMFAVDRKHRKIATQNLLRAEGMPRDPATISRLVRRVYEHFGTAFGESLIMPRQMARGVLREQMTLVDFHHLEEALRKGRGAIIVSPHLGNWELAGIRATMEGYPINSLTLPLGNPFIHEYFLRLRTAAGHRLIPREGAMKAMVQCLKANKVLVFLADQNAHEAGVLVPFFGRPASALRVPAIMSIKYGAPLVPMNLYRAPTGRHFVVATPPMEAPSGLDHETAVQQLTAAYTRRFEEFIRQHPDQWLWLHRRWRANPEIMAKQQEMRSREREARIKGTEFAGK